MSAIPQHEGGQFLLIKRLCTSKPGVYCIGVVTKKGSEQEFDRRSILGGFPENNKFGFGDGHTLSLEEQVV